MYVGEGTGGGGAYVGCDGGWVVGERGIMSNKDAVKWERRRRRLALML